MVGRKHKRCLKCIPMNWVMKSLIRFWNWKELKQKQKNRVIFSRQRYVIIAMNQINLIQSFVPSATKCKMILTYDEYVETLEKQKHKQDKIEILENRVEEVTTTLQNFMELIELQFGWESRYGKDKNETERKKRQLYQDLWKEGVRSAHWFMD